MDNHDAGGCDPTIAEAHPGSQPTTAVSLGSPATLSRYQLGQLLGRGGMGEIVAAHDDRVGRSVAIKRLLPGHTGAESLARFLREARIQGRLDHPAIVPVHDIANDPDGQPFFVMKRLSGTTLAEVIKRLAAGELDTVEQFSRQRLLRAFAEICLAIEFAHTRGVIHRDLKPANIVLGEFGEVYVLDWGVARVSDEPHEPASPASSESVDTGTGDVLGTAGYMAPEQARGVTDLDGRADIYALGCILFELLAYQPLHPRGIRGLMSAISGIDARPSVRAPGREIPPELDAICVIASATDREQRYRTPRALSNAVQSYLDGDRDLALRNEMAQGELAVAREALARGEQQEGRRDAIQAAARALALDPSNRETVALVGKLMLEPPANVPREVEDELDRVETRSFHATRRVVAASHAAYLVILPVLYWQGYRNGWFHVTAAVVAGLGLLSSIASLRRPDSRLWLISFGCGLLIIAMMSWLFSPFWIAPALGVGTAMTVAALPRLVRPSLVLLTILMAVLGPWLLELAGLSAPSMSIVANHVTLSVQAENLHPQRAMVALVVYVLAIITFAVRIPYRVTAERRAAQRAVQLQAWQLRQLVPSGVEGKQ